MNSDTLEQALSHVLALRAGEIEVDANRVDPQRGVQQIPLGGRGEPGPSHSRSRMIVTAAAAVVVLAIAVGVGRWIAGDASTVTASTPPESALTAVEIYLRPEVGQVDIAALERALLGEARVRAVEFVSQQDAYDALMASDSDLAEGEVAVSSLPPSFRVTLRADVDAPAFVEQYRRDGAVFRVEVSGRAAFHWLVQFGAGFDPTGTDVLTFVGPWFVEGSALWEIDAIVGLHVRETYGERHARACVELTPGLPAHDLFDIDRALRAVDGVSGFEGSPGPC